MDKTGSGGDLGADPGILGDHLARKQRLLSRVAFSFAIILATYLAIVSYLLPGLTPAKVLGLITLAIVAVAGWAARYPGWFHPSAMTVVVTTIVAGFGASLSNGGLEGYVTPILITAPIISALFLGHRATMVTAVAVIFTLGLLVVFGHLDLVKPTAYPPGATTIAAFVLLAAAALLCAAGVAHFVEDSERLVSSLVGTQNDLIAMAKRLETAAYHDPLTGLANRKKLNQHLDHLLSDGTMFDERICVIHVDLDKFKEVNDELGHAVGDGVLRNTACIMREHFRSSDLIARIGGDEFVIVAALPRQDSLVVAQGLCDRLIEHLKQPISVNGVECQVGASAGYVFADKGCSSAETLIANADIALYDAKRMGRGHARHFNSRMREGLERRRTLITSIEQAISQNRVTCLLQPQICLRTGRVSKVEALGRIRTVDGTLLAPDVFLDLAEEMGVVDVFDQMVVQCALQSLSTLRTGGHDLPQISINASAKSLRMPAYLGRLTTLIHKSGLHNGDVTVEVLETVLVDDDNDRAAQTIRGLKGAGLRVVLDDFGVGYTSMDVLAKLHFDGIKIDRSLITDPHNPRSIQVLKAIRGLARELELTTVIEGIEEAGQLHLAKTLGYDHAQGYGICRPMELNGLKDWLEAYGTSPANHLRGSVEAYLDGVRTARTA